MSQASKIAIYTPGTFVSATVGYANSTNLLTGAAPFAYDNNTNTIILSGTAGGSANAGAIFLGSTPTVRLPPIPSFIGFGYDMINNISGIGFLNKASNTWWGGFIYGTIANVSESITIGGAGVGNVINGALYAGASAGISQLTLTSSGNILSGSTNIISGANSGQTTALTVVGKTTTNNQGANIVTILQANSSLGVQPGFGAAMVFNGQNAATQSVSVAAIAAPLVNVTASAESGALDIYTANGVGGLNRNFRFDQNGAFLVGPTASLPSNIPGVGLPFNGALYIRDSNNATWTSIVYTAGVNNLYFGGSSFVTLTGLGGLSLLSNVGNLQLLVQSANVLQMGTLNVVAAQMLNNTTWQWGANDASATPSNFTHRASNGTGTNINAATMSFSASLGTGTGSAGYISLVGGVVSGSSGTGQHTYNEGLRVYGNYLQYMNGTNVSSSVQTANFTASFAISTYYLSNSAGLTCSLPSPIGAVNTRWEFLDITGNASVSPFVIAASGSTLINGNATYSLNRSWGGQTICIIQSTASAVTCYVAIQ